MYAISYVDSRSVQGILELRRAPLVYNHFGNVKMELHSRIHVSSNVLAITWKNSSNILSNICFTFGSKQLKLFDYSHNNTFQITDHCFYKNTRLNVIIFSQNKLKHITTRHFIGCTKLQNYDITRMHYSRMRTIRCSGHRIGDVCLGRCLPRGVSA